MSRVLLLLAILLTISGCVLGGDPPAPTDVPAAPEVVVAPEVPVPEVPIPPPPAPEPVFHFSLGPAPSLPPAPEVPKPITLKGSGKDARQAPGNSPAQLIEEANKTARLGISARGYFGGGGTYRYQWTPGRIYDVYLTAASGTKIIFPPGEVLAHELVLNPDAFDVSSATITTELSKTTVLFIRPCTEGEQACKPVTNVDVALVSESGRSYDLHLIVGKVGMVGVTWAIAPIPRLQLEEEPSTRGGRP